MDKKRQTLPRPPLEYYRRLGYQDGKLGCYGTSVAGLKLTKAMRQEYEAGYSLGTAFPSRF